MTAVLAEPGSLAGRHMALVEELHAVLARHGRDQDFCLLFRPESLQLGSGEVLVQRVTAEGTMELRPCPIDQLKAGMVPHSTQVVELEDSAFIGHSRARTARGCTNGGGAHYYS